MVEIADFRGRFDLLTANWDWEIEGFVDKSGFVYPIDTDTKVISTVFERLASPVIRTIAKENGFIVETANQTTYPDFTLTNEVNGHRIAIDIKTTYLSNRMIMTLGGYNSFLRNDTKNILYPYSTYREHWILGFIYEQRAAFSEYDLDNMPKVGDIACPYLIKTKFLRQKHEISGIRAGSGNTKNIGSVMARAPEEFTSVEGPFMRFNLSREACDYFWKNYEDFNLEICNADELTKHPKFRKFQPIK